MCIRDRYSSNNRSLSLYSIYRILSDASRFGDRFGGNNRRNSSKKGFFIPHLKIKDYLVLTFENLFILVLLEFDNSFRGYNLVLDLFDLFLLGNKLLFNFSSITG